MPRLRTTGGFVLTVVIFAVAALSIAGTALFLVVQSENAMANTSAESSRALHLANAGLSRYMGETFGAPRAEVRYDMAGGIVNVSAERVLSQGDTMDLYVVRSEATIADRRVPNLVARRAVQQFAHLRTRPFNPVAAMTVATASVQPHAQTVIDGTDACGVTPAVLGLARLGNRPYPSQAELVSAIGADWAAITDTAFPFDYEDQWPSSGFDAAADSFPTVRFSRDVTIGPAVPSGRGILVVDGKLIINSNGNPWTWDGVIMAGSVEIRLNGTASVNGALLTGFEGTQGTLTQNAMKGLRIHYNSCNVSSAGRRMSVFSPLANTWWETSD
jgi:hypothetical protein